MKIRIAYVILCLKWKRKENEKNDKLKTENEKGN